MIQRIQTLYLFIALLAFAAAYLFPQISTQPEVYTLSDLNFSIFPIGLLVGMLAANIFNYKKRPLQMALGRIIIIVAFLTFAYLAYGHFTHGGQAPGYALIAPLLGIVLVSLANKAIRKDEELVQSANRFR
jgi:peptidoglycan/LPS O-acetylase OafA/YrhL